MSMEHRGKWACSIHQQDLNENVGTDVETDLTVGSSQKLQI
jgi:hypothetical protein